MYTEPSTWPSTSSGSARGRCHARSTRRAAPRLPSPRRRSAPPRTPNMSSRATAPRLRPCTSRALGRRVRAREREYAVHRLGELDRLGEGHRPLPLVGHAHLAVAERELAWSTSSFRATAFAMTSRSRPAAWMAPSAHERDARGIGPRSTGVRLVSAGCTCTSFGSMPRTSAGRYARIESEPGRCRSPAQHATQPLRSARRRRPSGHAVPVDRGARARHVRRGGDADAAPARALPLGFARSRASPTRLPRGRCTRRGRSSSP